MKSTYDELFSKINAVISSNGLESYTAKQLTTEISDGVFAALQELVTFHFTVWEPRFQVTVYPDGGYVEDAVDPFKNPFLAVTEVP